MRFSPPAPLLVGRLMFELDDSAGLSKTTANFLALCTGEKGPCKNAPNKKLHYLGCPVHRIVRGFVAQGGDVTRGDGTGGEVCEFTVKPYGSLFPIQYSTCMVNRGRLSPKKSLQVMPTETIVIVDEHIYVNNPITFFCASRDYSWKPSVVSDSPRPILSHDNIHNI